MFAKFKDPILFKRIIDSLCVLVDDINIICNEIGLSFQGMDDQRISYFSMDINHNFFETYECRSEIIIGCRLHSIQQILKCVDKAMPLSIKTNEQKTKLEFMSDFEEHNLYLSIDIIDNESELLNITESEYDATITLPSNDFNKIITNLNQNGNNVNISIKKNKVILTPDTNANSIIKIDPTQSKEIKYNNNSNSIFEVDFSIRYLSFFTKPHTFTNSVKIKLSKSSVLCVEYSLFYNSCCIRYFLAPMNNDSSSDSDGETEEIVNSVINICKMAYNYFKKS